MKRIETPRQDATRDVSDTLFALQRRMRGPAGHAPHGITQSQGETIYLIEAAGDPGARTSQIAEELGVSSSAITQLVDGLVDRGLVERRPDAADRRATRLHLTAEGIRLYALFDEARMRSASALLDSLSTDEVVDLASLMRRVVDR